MTRLGALTPMTCCKDGLEHAVAEADFAAGLRGGIYLAICDHLIVPKALISPPGLPCPACGTALSGTSHARAARQPSRRFTGWRIALRSALAESSAVSGRHSTASGPPTSAGTGGLLERGEHAAWPRTRRVPRPTRHGRPQASVEHPCPESRGGFDV